MEREHGNTKSTYPIDAESAAEMARLLRQEQLVTQSMGGIFPEQLDLRQVERILDVACGPGGWVLETAFAHRDIDVVGIDMSEQMIRYAQMQAQVQQLENAHFQVMDVLKPLAFPDASFDVVNTRLIVTFMPPSVWPHFLQECWRILRPGGIIRLTDMEWGFSNKDTHETYCRLFNQALFKAGQSFSPNGTHLGLLPVLPRLVQEAGFEQVQKRACSIDYSFGTEAHEGYYLDLQSAFHLLQPFIAKWNTMNQQEVASLCEQTLLDMQMEDFCAYAMFLTVWGTKAGSIGA